MQQKSQKNHKNKISKLPWNWNKQGGLIYGETGDISSELIAAFDMDGTLIQTKSGAKYPKSSHDWKFWHESVVEIIKGYSDQGFKIVIFTNQRGISKGHINELTIKKKIEQIAEQLDIKVTALIASAYDQYSKPNTGMWKYFTTQLNDGREINFKESFFIGDAAGRQTLQNKDHSDFDLKYAINVGLNFKTPEQFFLKQDLDQDFIEVKSADLLPEKDQ